MKKFALTVILAMCAAQAVHAGEDPIKNTIRNRAARKAKANRARLVRELKQDKQRADDDRRNEAIRQRVMENERHAATVQHAVNGANANAMQAQSNAIQAQRNAVLAESNRAIQRAAGIAVCSVCGATGHYSCGQGVQKTQAVLEYEMMLRGMIP